MSITTAPGVSFEATVDNAGSGLTGTITVRIEDGLNNIVTAASTTGIVESGTGIYTATRTAPSTAGQYLVIWNNGSGSEAVEELVVAYSADLTAGTPYYSTPVLLRDELDVNNVTLTDPDAIRLILQAEDLIDSLLGFWAVDETTGRKIVQADTDGWKWTKLERATTLCAANLYRKPSVLTSTQWEEIKGPDFWFTGRISGPLAEILSPLVVAVLNASTLRRLSARSGVGTRDRAPWYPFTHNDPNEP